MQIDIFMQLENMVLITSHLKSFVSLSGILEEWYIFMYEIHV